MKNVGVGLTMAQLSAPCLGNKKAREVSSVAHGPNFLQKEMDVAVREGRW